MATCSSPLSRNRTVGVELAKGRTIDEITAWSRMDPATRRAVMAELPARAEAAKPARRGGRDGRCRCAGEGGEARDAGRRQSGVGRQLGEDRAVA